jgi:3',5'-cyclic AMP phosphodiesterase CpdA
VRIIHLSDIHFWRFALNPLRLLGKRAVGMTSLLLGRARRFRLERIPELVERVNSLAADHILITGDLTTTALPVEFRAVRSALGVWLTDRERVTIIPGNHDRYTLYADHSRRFEHYLGEFAPQHSYPWLRRLDARTGIVGLDPTRSGITASGKLPRAQLVEAQQIVAAAGSIDRLVIACHYPAAVPRALEHHYTHKPLVNRASLVAWLRTLGPHLYCCGHLHAAWAYRPDEIPNQLSLNAGAPLMRDRSGANPPGFLEIELDGPSVVVHHHTWTPSGWNVRIMFQASDFFAESVSGC